MIEYPKIFKECPLCHCPSRIVDQEIKAEQEKGKIPKDKWATSRQEIVPIMDPTAMGFSFPVLFSYFDICENCGHEFRYKIIKETLTSEQYRALIGQALFTRSAS